MSPPNRLELKLMVLGLGYGGAGGHLMFLQGVFTRSHRITGMRGIVFNHRRVRQLELESTTNRGSQETHSYSELRSIPSRRKNDAPFQ